MSGKRYPEEFKTEAVKQVVDTPLFHQANPPTTASFLCAYRDTERGCKFS